MIKLLAILILSIFPLLCNAQIVTAFYAHQINNSVKIDFTVLSGNTCNGIDILRSNDSLNYFVVGDISGICGSASTDESYSFTDNNPKVNSDNFYKLDLKQLGFSAIVKIHVYEQSNSLIVFPNPVSSTLNLYAPFQNSKFSSFDVYDIYGKVIIGNKEIITNPFEINVENLLRGIYFIVIRNDGLEFSGTFLKE
jgi:hypothetical protein